MYLEEENIQVRHSGNNFKSYLEKLHHFTQGK